MSYNKTKCDPELGRAVHQHLLNIGMETPGVSMFQTMDRKDKIQKIRDHFTEIMNILGLDLSDDSLMDTPNRVAKMYVNEIFWGLDVDSFPKCTAVENKMKYDEMVIERDINVQSNCEHHFVVIDGLATIGYIPNKKVLGLSKLNRIVEYFSKRPQIQERLTEQVFHALCFILDTEDVAVVINAQHYCVKSRGVEDTGSSTITSKLGGGFKDKDSPLRQEFMAIVNSSRNK